MFFNVFSYMIDRLSGVETPTMHVTLMVVKTTHILFNRGNRLTPYS